jgi:hypothetical protein
MGCLTHFKGGLCKIRWRAVAERFHLDSVTTLEGTTWFTLVIEEPAKYFVEQYNDAKTAFATNRTKRILPSEFSKHWVNGIPLVMLIENKLGELVEDAHIKALKDSIEYLKQNPRPKISNQDSAT